MQPFQDGETFFQVVRTELHIGDAVAIDGNVFFVLLDHLEHFFRQLVKGLNLGRQESVLGATPNGIKALVTARNFKEASKTVGQVFQGEDTGILTILLNQLELFHRLFVQVVVCNGAQRDVEFLFSVVRHKETQLFWLRVIIELCRLVGVGRAHTFQNRWSVVTLHMAGALGIDGVPSDCDI